MGAREIDARSHYLEPQRAAQLMSRLAITDWEDSRRQGYLFATGKSCQIVRDAMRSPTKVSCHSALTVLRYATHAKTPWSG